MYAWFKSWRRHELEKIRLNATHLLVHGYVKIDSIPPIMKRQIWNSIILPQLTAHWSTVHKDLNFSLNSESTWPRPEKGTSYDSNLTDAKQNEYPKLFSTNFMAQAIISYLFDETLQAVSFGEQTHCKLRLLRSSNSSILSLLLSALYLDGLLSSKSSSSVSTVLNLRGNDHGWNLINWPQSRHLSGTAIPSKAHIDGGECFYYKRGLPTDGATYAEILLQRSLPHDGSNDDTVRHRRRLTILSMLLWQIAIIFYCDTPGDLTAQEGATGFYTGSHWAIVDALNRITDTVSVPQSDTLTRSEKNTPAGPAVEYTDFVRGMKLFGSSRSHRLTQPAILDGQALLCLGQVAHTIMWATKPMMTVATESDATSSSSSGSGSGPRAMPRSIQNAKVTATELLRPSLPPQSPQQAVIQAARLVDPRRSLLAQFAEDPRGLLKKLLSSGASRHYCDGVGDLKYGSRDNEFLRTMEEDSDFLFEQWSRGK